MLPALYQLARQLYQDLRPEQLIEGNSETATEKKAAVLLANHLLIDFLEQHATASSKKGQALCVQTTATYCVHLSDLLSEFRQQLQDTGIRGKDLSAHGLFYEGLQKSILGLLELVQNGFGRNLDPGLRMPVCLQETIRPIFKEQLARLAQNEETATDHSLTSQLCHQLKMHANNPNLSYGTHDHLQQLLYQLLLPEHSSMEARIKLLIRYNLNDPVWIDQLIHYWAAQRESLGTSEEKTAFWRNSQLELTRLQPIHNQALHPDQKSCKELLLEAIALEEITHGDLFSESPADRDKPFETTLSVSQLGLFLRLQVDTQILQTSNKNELIRQTASRYRTIRTTQISPENLHKKFYTCDPAAISIMRVHLVNMMNWLKRYG